MSITIKRRVTAVVDITYTVHPGEDEMDEFNELIDDEDKVSYLGDFDHYDHDLEIYDILGVEKTTFEVEP